MQTKRLFVLALVTALVGVLPWFTGVALLLKIFGTLLTGLALVIAYLTGSQMIADRKANGCGQCETCSCLTGKLTGSTTASV